MPKNKSVFDRSSLIMYIINSNENINILFQLALLLTVATVVLTVQLNLLDYSHAMSFCALDTHHDR